MEKEKLLERLNIIILDVIISVGYRVKSKRGIEFRRWANSVLKQYIIIQYGIGIIETARKINNSHRDVLRKLGGSMGTPLLILC